MLQVIHRMSNNLWSNPDLPAVWGNYRLKTLWKEKVSSRPLVSMEDLASDKQRASWSLISSQNKSECGMRHNSPKNRRDLEKNALQQVEYIQWKEFIKCRIVKNNIYIYYFLTLQQYPTTCQGNGCSTRLDSFFVKVIM